ncbi:MAG: hypothetical protein FWD51_01050 [Betaproteobacteria bacterium]|nr:hypothetical protein [Betaproteobacteria bacterium]
MQLPNHFSDLLRPFRGTRLAWACRTGKYQRGQALTEVLITSMFVLIPTFAISWALYAYGQARTTALNGARYAAWERTVWRASPAPGAKKAAVRSAGDIENFMVERFFAKPDAAIQSTYTSPTDADLPSFYSVHNGDKVISINSAAPGGGAGGGGDWEATRPKLALQDSGETTSTVSTVYNEIAKFTSILGGEQMELEDKGLYVANVSFKLNNIKNLATFDSLNLEIKQTAAVMVDSWSAGGKKHEEAIVKPLVPASLIGDLYDKFGAFIDIMNSIGALPFKDFKPGCIRADVVPKEALPSGQSQTGGKCN